MLKTKRFYRYIAFAVAFALISMLITISVFAATGQSTNGIQNKDSGGNAGNRPMAMKDGSKNTLKPYNYNGLDYFTLQEYARALKMKVSYDSATNTVIITASTSGAISADGNTTKGAFRMERGPATPGAIGIDGNTTRGAFRMERGPATPGAIGIDGNTTRGAFRMERGSATPGAIGIDGNTTRGAFRMERGSATPGAIGIDGNTTRGAFRMEHGRTTPGAIGIGGNTSKGGIHMQGRMTPDQGNSTGGGIKMPSDQEKPTVTFKDIKITVNGEQVTLKDESGTVLEPFFYGRDVYLPIKALSDAMDVVMTYDTTSGAIHINGDQ